MPGVADREFESLMDEAADLIRSAGSACALTGAGISVESGIPDFRSPGGLWDRFDPADYAHMDSFRADPGRVWNMLAEMDEVVSGARPNPAHQALADMERRGLLQGIITQNVDGLHQAAGSENVIEFHGSHTTLRCLDCRRTHPRESVDLTARPPRCECGGPIKPDIIFFGEAIPQQALERAVRLASTCAVMLIVGTSATVVPASMMPMLALESRARLIAINKETTDLTRAAHLSLLGSAGDILPRIVERL